MTTPIQRIPRPIRKALARLLAAGGIVIQPARLRPPAPAFAWIAVEGGPLRGASFYLDTHRETTAPMQRGDHDRFFFDLLAARDLRGATIWDVGAHIGYHALAFAALVGPDGTVCAFEPSAPNRARFEQHLARNPHLSGPIRLYPYALAEFDGEAAFKFTAEDYGSDSGYLEAHQRPLDRAPAGLFETFSAQTVRVRTGDSLLAEGLPRPDLIKIDVEGAELAVLHGLRGLLSAPQHAGQRPALFVEVHSIQVMFHVVHLLTAHGYALSLHDDPLRAANSRAFVWAE